jgi:hypothetical protein
VEQVAGNHMEARGKFFSCKDNLLLSLPRRRRGEKKYAFTYLNSFIIIIIIIHEEYGAMAEDARGLFNLLALEFYI